MIMASSSSPSRSLPAAGVWAGRPFAELDGLAALATPWTVRQGETLFAPGEPVERIGLVQRGRVRLLLSHGLGDRGIPAGVAGSGALLDVAALFLEPARHFRRAEALTDCRLLAFPAPLLRGLLAQRPDWAATLLAQLSREVEEQSTRARRLLKCGSCRFILHVLDLVRGTSDIASVHLESSRREIAEQLAIKPETLSRILTALTQDGHLQVAEKGSRILTIPSVRGLAALTTSCPRCVDDHGEARCSPGLELAAGRTEGVPGRGVASRVSGVSSMA